MKKILYSTLFIAITGLMPVGCSNSHSDSEHSHSYENHEHSEAEHGNDHSGAMHDEEKEHHEAHGNKSDSKDEITLHSEVAERFGVKTDTVSPGIFHEVIRATGQVLPSGSSAAVVAAPKAGIVHFSNIALGTSVGRGSAVATIDSKGISGGDSNASAKAAMENAKRELDRLQPLYDSRLVTASEYNAAKTAYEQAVAAYSPRANSGTAVSPISGVITSLDVAEGQYVESGAPIASVSSAKDITIRIDVPRKYGRTLSSYDNAILELPYSDSVVDIVEAGGKRVGGEALTQGNATSAYLPVYFTAHNDGALNPGSVFTAYLTGAPRNNVVTIPESALSEQQGQYYVYKKIDSECYNKQLVRTGASDGKRVEILSGLESGDVVVVEGVTTVRLSESGSVIPQGHTHNH